MVKVTIEAEGKVETLEGDCFCGFLIIHKNENVEAANVMCGKIKYNNAVQSLLHIWKMLLEEITKGDKELKEMLRADFVMKLSAVDLDRGGADGGKDWKK